MPKPTKTWDNKKKFLNSLKNFTTENAKATLNKNLQKREQLPKKKRERSHPEASNRNYKLTQQVQVCEGDESKHILPESRLQIEHFNHTQSSFYNKAGHSRSTSLTSLHSSRSNFDVLVGWAYTKTKNGDQGTVSKREAYESRYINDRVEIELDEFKDEISRKFKNNKTKNFTFPRKISEAQPQYGKKASAIEPSKTQKISKGDKNEKNHSQAVRDYIKQEDIVPKEMNSDSKLQNMSKYIKTSYKPFEYKDTKKHSKLKTKYFYPKKTQKMQMINIKNCENSVNIEYDEDKMLSMFESTFYSQGKPKKLNKQNSKEINEIPFEKTNHTSQITDMNRNSYESKLKECVRTQNQQTLNKLLISSCNSSVSRKQQKKADRSKNPNLSKSSNPFSSQDNGNNYNMQSE